MLLGRNKSGQFSEIFGTSHRRSDQVLNIRKSWKMVNVHLQGSSRAAILIRFPSVSQAQCVGSWLLSHTLQCTLDGKSLHRAATKLPMVVLLQISTQEMETINMYAVNLVSPSYGRCTVHVSVSSYRTISYMWACS